MELGIPGEGGEPPARRPGVGHAVKWLLAAVAVAPAYLLVQVVAALVVGIALLTTNIDLLTAAATLASLVFAVLWWLYLRPQALVRLEVPRPSSPAGIALLACTLLALGMALQVAISAALTLVLPLFPEVMDEYIELMELIGVSEEMRLLTLLETTVLAPIAEEALCRGVALEFSLRAFCPELRAGWSRGRREGTPAIGEKDLRSRHEIPDARFWAANAFQALIFAVMHLNIVQGVYAFAFGLLLGWIVRRTGRLRAAALLHMAVNGASELMVLLDPLIGDVLVPVLVVAAVVSAALVWAVARLTAGEPRRGAVAAGPDRV